MHTWKSMWITFIIKLTGFLKSIYIPKFQEIQIFISTLNDKIKRDILTQWQDKPHLRNFDSISALISDVRWTVEPSSLHMIFVHLGRILSGAPFENIIWICFRLQSTLIIFRSRVNSNTETCHHESFKMIQLEITVVNLIKRWLKYE